MVTHTAWFPVTTAWWGMDTAFTNIISHCCHPSSGGCWSHSKAWAIPFQIAPPPAALLLYSTSARNRANSLSLMARMRSALVIGGLYAPHFMTISLGFRSCRQSARQLSHRLSPIFLLLHFRHNLRLPPHTPGKHWEPKILLGGALRQKSAGLTMPADDGLRDRQSLGLLFGRIWPVKHGDVRI